MNFLEIKKKIINELDFALDKVEKADVFIRTILSADKVFVVGSGRSKLIIECFAQRLSHLGLKAYIVGSVLQPPAFKHDLLIVASGCGENIFPVSIAKKAKKIGMKIALITAEKNSRIAKISDLTIYIPAGSKFSSNKEKTSCQPLGALFEQCLLVFCDAVALMIQKMKNISTRDLRKNHANLE